MPRRRHAFTVLTFLATLLGGCVSTPPAPSGSGPGTSATSAEATSSPAPAPSNGYASAQPYTAAEILAAMRASRRPGGVPDEVEVQAVAAAIADAIWTFDGRPWSTMSAGGSCGELTCTIEIVGTNAGSSGQDLWSFDVMRSDWSVSVARRELGAVPDALRDDFDRLARTLVPNGRLDGLVLGAVTWLGPTDANAFELAYRSGNEESSCSIDVVLAPLDRAILDSRETDC
jgi:hypothetical protein